MGTRFSLFFSLDLDERILKQQQEEEERKRQRRERKKEKKVGTILSKDRSQKNDVKIPIFIYAR